MTTGRINQVTILDRPRADRPSDGRVSSPGANARILPVGSEEPPGTPDRTGLESPRTTWTEEGQRCPAPSSHPHGELPTDKDGGPRPLTDSQPLQQIPGQGPSTHQPPTGRGVTRRPSQPKVRQAWAKGKSRPFHAGADTGTRALGEQTGRQRRPSNGRALSFGVKAGEMPSRSNPFPMSIVRPHRPSGFRDFRFDVQTPERQTNVDTHRWSTRVRHGEPGDRAHP
jgi:hypothetical protein